MFCTRCGRDVPDILWKHNDHLVLLDNAMVVNMYDAPGTKNEVKVTAELYVEKRLCSEVFTVVRSDMLRE